MIQDSHCKFLHTPQVSTGRSLLLTVVAVSAYA